MPPHLLHFRVSHYNEKVRWALDFKGWGHTREALVPAFHRPRVRRVSGQNHPEPPLYPAAAREKAHAAQIESHYDEVVAPELRRLFWSTYLDRPADCARMATDGFPGVTHAAWQCLFPLMRPVLRANMQIYPHQVAEARKRLRLHFERLAREVGPSGYLVGERFSVADLAAAAVMTAIVRPPEFPYPLPEPWPAPLRALRESVSALPGFKWVLDIYARHRGKSCEII